MASWIPDQVYKLVNSVNIAWRVKPYWKCNYYYLGIFQTICNVLRRKKCKVNDSRENIVKHFFFGKLLWNENLVTQETFALVLNDYKNVTWMNLFSADNKNT